MVDGLEDLGALSSTMLFSRSYSHCLKPEQVVPCEQTCRSPSDESRLLLDRNQLPWQSHPDEGEDEEESYPTKPDSWYRYPQRTLPNNIKQEQQRFEMSLQSRPTPKTFCPLLPKRVHKERRNASPSIILEIEHVPWHGCTLLVMRIVLFEFVWHTTHVYSGKRQSVTLLFLGGLWVCYLEYSW